MSGLGDEMLGNVLNAGDLGFGLVQDNQNLKSACDFWVQWEAAATINGGYSPPGSVVPSPYVSGTAGASSNY